MRRSHVIKACHVHGILRILCDGVSRERYMTEKLSPRAGFFQRERKADATFVCSSIGQLSDLVSPGPDV